MQQRPSKPSSKDMRTAYDAFMKQRQQRVDTHLDRLRDEEAQATAAAALKGGRGGRNRVSEGVRQRSGTLDEDVSALLVASPVSRQQQQQARNSLQQPPGKTSSSLQTPSPQEAKESQQHFRRASSPSVTSPKIHQPPSVTAPTHAPTASADEASAAPSPFHILVTSVIEPILDYSSLGFHVRAEQLEHFFGSSVAIKRQGAATQRSEDNANDADVGQLRQQLWHTVHNLVFYCVRELSTPDEEQETLGQQPRTDADEGDDDGQTGAWRHTMTCPTSLRERLQWDAAVAHQHQHKRTVEKDKSVTSVEWLFVLQCFAEWSYPRRALFLQSPQDGDVCELFAAVLWLCKRFQLPLIAAHISLMSTATKSSVSSKDFRRGGRERGESDDDCNSAHQLVVAGRDPFEWPPASFDEYESANHRMRSLQKRCEILHSNSRRGNDDTQELADDDEQDQIEIKQERYKQLIHLQRNVRLNTNRILSLLLTRAEQLVTLGGVHCSDDYVLCLPRNAAKYQAISNQLEQVAGLRESFERRLYALNECGKLLLSHMTLQGRRDSSGSDLLCDAHFRLVGEDAKREENVLSEDAQRFATLCLSDGRSVHAGAQEMWNRLTRHIVRDIRNGQEIVGKLTEGCKAAVMTSMKAQYSLQTCLLTEAAASLMKSQEGRGAASSDKAKVYEGSAVVASTALQRLLRSPLLRSTSTAIAASPLTQETLVGAPGPGKSTSAQVEFARLRHALTELEKSVLTSSEASGEAALLQRLPRAVSWLGLEEFVESNELRVVARKARRIQQHGQR